MIILQFVGCVLVLLGPAQGLTIILRYNLVAKVEKNHFLTAKRQVTCTQRHGQMLKYIKCLIFPTTCTKFCIIFNHFNLLCCRELTRICRKSNFLIPHFYQVITGEDPFQKRGWGDKYFLPVLLYKRGKNPRFRKRTSAQTE